MMGYTHTAIGSATALTVSMLMGEQSPEMFLVASVAGAVGGILEDIDCKDNKRVTDAGRTRLSVLILLCISVICHFVLIYNRALNMTVKDFIGSINGEDTFNTGQRISSLLFGMVCLTILLLLAYHSRHRTFSHSLTFIFLGTLCVDYMVPKATPYYFIGGLSHLLIDFLNYPFEGHGIWLFYPIKTGCGIAFKICKAGSLGNKIIYFTGIITYTVVSIFYIYKLVINVGVISIVVPVIVLAYMLIATNLVRIKSEKELS